MGFCTCTSSLVDTPGRNPGFLQCINRAVNIDPKYGPTPIIAKDSATHAHVNLHADHFYVCNETAAVCLREGLIENDGNLFFSFLAGRFGRWGGCMEGTDFVEYPFPRPVWGSKGGGGNFLEILELPVRP